MGLLDLILAEKVVPDPQLLIDAEQQAGVMHPDAGPFQLDVDFVVYVQVPATGHLTAAMESRRLLLSSCKHFRR